MLLAIQTTRYHLFYSDYSKLLKVLMYEDGLQGIYNIRIQVVSDIQTLAFRLSLYIRCNTAAYT